MLLTVSDLRASIDGKEILRGIDLTVRPGEVHAIMGPNGGGKSTFAYALMGHPAYRTTGTLKLGAKNIAALPAEGRAKAGLFLAFQSPIAVPGVTVIELLRTAVGEEKHKIHNPVLARRPMVEFIRGIKKYAHELHMDESFLSRGIHDGFSGGEKKKLEMLEALVLAPKFAVFDEIDTGLDVDALKIVAAGIQQLVQRGTGIIVVTHYQRILRYVRPDVVHVLVGGKIVKTGTSSLAKEIETNGYNRFTV